MTISDENSKGLRQRQIGWLPVLATALMFYNCYIPGRSSLNCLGVAIWLGVCFWHVLKTDFLSRLVSGGGIANPRATWVIAVLFVFSMITLTPWPLRLAFQPGQLNSFVRTHREIPASLKIANIRPGEDVVRYSAGIYPLITYEIEPNGSAYLVTEVDDFGPDEFYAHGFAYKPAAVAPFGREDKYNVKPFLGDWYIFNYKVGN